MSTYDTTIAYTKNEDFNSGGTGGFTANTGTVSNPTGNQLHMTANWASKPLATTSVYLVNGRSYTLNLDIVGFSVVSGFSHTVRVRVVLPGAAFNTDFTTTGTKTITFTSNTTGYVNIEIRSIISPPTGVYSGNPYIDIENFKVSWDSAFTSSDTICVSKSGYRYGFNGMEKDFGLSENGDVYTAEFWEYDARLGRRWNIDPVTKFYQSVYTTFSSNPIIYIDPNGDDDFFDCNGNYLGSTAEGNKIRIVNDGITFEIAILNIKSTTRLLSSIYFGKTKIGLENRRMLKKVLTYYAFPLDIYKVGSGYKLDESAIAYFDPTDGFVTIKINKKGKISKLLDDINNLKCTLTHEKTHRDNPKTSESLYHYKAIIAEYNSPFFANTTPEFKKSNERYAKYLFQKSALEKNDDGGYMYSNEEIQTEIDAYNSIASKLGLSSLIYDPKTRKIIEVYTIGTGVIKSGRKKDETKTESDTASSK